MLNHINFIQKLVIISIFSFTVVSCGNNKKNDSGSNYSQSKQEIKSEIHGLIEPTTKLYFKVIELHIHLKKLNEKLGNDSFLFKNGISAGDIDKINEITYPVQIIAESTFRNLLSDLFGNGNYSDTSGIPNLLKEMRFQYDLNYPTLTEINRKKEEIKHDIKKLDQIFKTTILRISGEIPNTTGKSLILNGNSSFKGLKDISNMTSDATNILK